MKRLLLLTVINALLPISALGIVNSHIHQLDTLLDNGISVMVDERFELVSIAFRLAEASEYTIDSGSEYLRQVDQYFSPYKGHKLISFIKKTRRSFNFGYSIAAKSSLMIELKNGHVRANKEWDPKKEFSEEYASCWNESVFIEYVRLLDSFYRASRFHSFFVSHLGFYENAVRSCTDIPSSVNLEWFEQFFGEPSIGVDLILGLCIGGSNYSIHDVRRKIDWDGRLAIMIGTFADGNGMPYMMLDHPTTIVHEIAHYYSSPIIDRSYPEMEESMAFVFSKVRESMRNIGYGDAESVTGEWINELFVNCYLYENKNADWELASHVSMDVESGYIWMDRAVSFMRYFYDNRDMYHTIGEFMPQLTAFTNSLPEKWETIDSEFSNRHPYVVDIFPANGHFSASTKRISVKFSEPMLMGINGTNNISGLEPFPCNYTDFKWEDEQTFIIDLENSEIIPGKTYGIELLPYAFICSHYYRLSEAFNIILMAD